MFILDRLSNEVLNLLQIIENNELRIYMCGPTLYRKPHIGNFRCAIFVDLITSWLKIQNINAIVYASITDIGHCFDNTEQDKVIKLAQEQNIQYYHWVHQYYTYYIEMINILGLKQINYVPASSLEPEYYEHLDKINQNDIYQDENNNIRVKQEFIKKYNQDLIFRGSRLKDFVLWKTDELGIYKYKDLVGNPGWHIECFGIIKKNFNKRSTTLIDLHIGGVDLLDIHNNAEIIHSKLEDENIKLSKCWTSVGTVTYQGHKMSKSDNNVIYIDEFIEQYNVPILKLWIYGVKYDSNLDFNSTTISNVVAIYNKIIDRIASLIFQSYSNANSNIFDILGNLSIQGKEIHLLSLYPDCDTRKMISDMLIITDLKQIYAIDQILNTQIFKHFLIRQQKAQQFLYLQIKRMYFKAQKNFKEADKIRDVLLNNGIKIMEIDYAYFIY